jgi:DNA-binding MarR family transcriptional regulator
MGASMTAKDLERIDQALIGLRHLWSGPVHLQDAALGKVEMSTVWIVNALASPGPRDREAMSIRDLADSLGVAHSTASRLVDRAATIGAVTREPDAHDARLTVVTLTDSGRTLAETARWFRTGYLADATATWTADERATFADLLTRFAHSINATPPEDLEEPR